MSDLMTEVLQEIQLENQAWAQQNLKAVKVGQALTFPHRGIAGACQLVLREFTSLGEDRTYVFSVVLYGVMTGKEVLAVRASGRWSFRDTKVKA
jgi:hypothetical protein